MPKVKFVEKIAYTFINETFYILNIQGDLLKLDGIGSDLFKYLINGVEICDLPSLVMSNYLGVDLNVVKQDINEFIYNMYYYGIIDLDGFKKVDMVPKYIVPTHYGELWDISSKLKIPLKVDIELSGNCNLHCKYCFVEIQNNNEKSNNLNKDRLFKLFDDLKEMGTLFITFTGGECTLHPRFLEILEYALSKKFYIRVLTNGTTFDDNRYNDFLNTVNKGIVSVDVSLHSVVPNTFDEFVGRKNSFNKMEEFLSRFSKTDIPLNLKFNITKDNFNDIEKTKAYCDNRKYNVLFNSLILPKLSGVTNSEFYIDNQHAEKLSKTGLIKSGYHKCTALDTKCWIDYFGNVNVCELIRQSSGNIINESIKDIWKRLITDKSYKELCKEDEECKNCDSRLYCNICPGIIYLNGKKEGYCDIVKLSKNIS